VDHGPIDVPVEHLTRAPAVDGPLLDVLAGPRHQLLHLRVPEPDTVRDTDAGTVVLAPKRGHRVALTDPLGSPVFVGVRQRHLHFECEVELALRPAHGAMALPDGLEAGLVVYLDHERSYAACTDGRKVRFARVQPDGAKLESDVPLLDATTVRLRVRGTPEKYVFERAATGGAWEMIGEGETAGVSGGFTGTIVAVYAVSGEGESGADFEVEAQGWKYRATAEE
jgi:hypothetical protein